MSYVKNRVNNKAKHKKLSPLIAIPILIALVTSAFCIFCSLRSHVQEKETTKVPSIKRPNYSSTHFNAAHKTKSRTSAKKDSHSIRQFNHSHKSVSTQAQTPTHRPNTFNKAPHLAPPIEPERPGAIVHKHPYPRFNPELEEKYAHTGSWETKDFNIVKFLGVEFSSEKLTDEEDGIDFFSVSETKNGQRLDIYKASRLDLVGDALGFEHVNLYRSYYSDTLGYSLFVNDFKGKFVRQEDLINTIDCINTVFQEEFDLPEVELDYRVLNDGHEYYSFEHKQWPVRISYHATRNPDSGFVHSAMKIENSENMKILQSEGEEAINNCPTEEIKNWLANPYSSYWAL